MEDYLSMIELVRILDNDVADSMLKVYTDATNLIGFMHEHLIIKPLIEKDVKDDYENTKTW